MAYWHFTGYHNAELLMCCSVKTGVMRHSDEGNAGLALLQVIGQIIEVALPVDNLQLQLFKIANVAGRGPKA